MEPESFEFESIRAQNQEMLVDFIRVELRMGRTFVQSATLAKAPGHVDHYALSKANAVKAAESVRHFMKRIADEEICAEIVSKLEELDRLIGAL
jgi:hypothetical protein